MKNTYKNFIATIFILVASVIGVIAQPLVGIYTINSGQATGGTNFQSFSDFSSALATNGISGNVIADVVIGSGPYNEQVVFTAVTGASPSASVTINGNGETITAVTTTTDRHVIRLTDVEFFNIDGLRINWNPASTGGFYGIHIFNTGNDITITNCYVDLSGTTSTLYGAYVASGSETSILTTGDFHNIFFSNDTAVGGGYGVSVFGLISDLATDIVISNNTFYDFHSNGVYLRETDGAVIKDNFFDKRTSNITSVNAIQLAQAANFNSQVFGNFIKVSQTNNGTMPFRGIYLFNGTGHKVYNNVIYDINLISGDFTAIEVRTGGTAPEIYYNTISIDNPNQTSGELFGVSEELSNTNTVLMNNIIGIEQPTTAVKAAYSIGSISNITNTFTSNYNGFNIPGGNIAYRNATVPVPYPTLGDWQSISSQDMNSVEADPGFISSTNVVPTSGAMDNTGIVIPFVTTDIVGLTRSSTPDMGAYEFVQVGISSPEYINAVSMYPSPVHLDLNIVLNENSSQGRIEILDITGKLILTNEIEATMKEVSMNVSSLAAGCYLVRILNGDRLSIGRFVKN